MLAKVRPYGHGLKTYFAAFAKGFPAHKMKVVGITGTKGKTSTTVLTGRLLNLMGTKTGYISTASIFLGKGEEILNPFKMTTIDGAKMNSYLRQMVKNGCKCVIIEMSSQGLEQNRHFGLGGFDIGVFLNLFPEHIEAHGSFENYKNMKGKLFENIKRNGVVIGPEDFKESLEMFAKVPVDIKNTVTEILLQEGRDYFVRDDKNSIFKYLRMGENEVKTNFSADFEMTNLAFAVKIAEAVSGKNEGLALVTAKELKGIPGRMELVVKSKKFDIMVDYAHEPESMRRLLTTLSGWKGEGIYDNIIHIVSCDGVGRDDWKKPLLGDISVNYSDFSVVTTDNYEPHDNPQMIVDILSQNFDPKENDIKYVKVINRLEGFKIALEWAKSVGGKSIIVSTGVGVEHGLTQPSGTMEWDEREVWKGLVK